MNTPNAAAQGSNRSSTNDVTKAMGNLIKYEGPMQTVIRESLGKSETPFSGPQAASSSRTVDGASVEYNKVGGTSTSASNSAVIKVDGSRYIVTTGKGGVDGTKPQGDAVSDASIREAINQIRNLGKMGGPSNSTPQQDLTLPTTLQNVEVKAI